MENVDTVADVQGSTEYKLEHISEYDMNSFI